MNYTNYYDIFVFVFLSFGLSLLILYISTNLVIFFKDSEKLSVYECGFNPFNETLAKPFNVHFYLVGILFIIFDLEIIFLFPWCVTVGLLGLFSFWIMMLFLLILILGFWFEWSKGGLIW